jgi:MFS transporter, MHS family, proline/betaine transporter
VNIEIGDARSGEGISRRSMAIAAFSTMVEWYDFTLYLYMVTLLSRIFFGVGAKSLATTLAGFAVAYLMRPLGAAVFGHIGDRYGRRRTMLASMALMTAAMLATALLPTYAAIGPAAGLLLLSLRCVMGFSVGGEYTGVVAYLLEGAPRHRRGLITSMAAMASEIGALLAAGVAATTVASLDSAAFEVWGWRIPFFVGAALAGSVLLARSTMQESPEFERQQARGTVPRQPLRFALQYRSAIGRGFAISALGSITYYVGITYVPAFLSETGSLAEGEALWLSTLAALVVILVTPLVGLLTDRVGRKPVLVLLCVGAALLPATMFAWMAGGSDLRVLVGAVVLAAVGGGVSAVGAVTTAELLPGEGRLSGLALGATAATAIFGGFTPYLAQRLMATTGSTMVPGFMIAAVAIAVLPVLLTMRETRPRL